MTQMFGWRRRQHSQCLDEQQPGWPQMEAPAACLCYRHGEVRSVYVLTGTADKRPTCVVFEDQAVYWLDSHRLIAVFKDLLGVRIVVWRGRLVMGLLLFFLLNQLWMAVRS